MKKIFLSTALGIMISCAVTTTAWAQNHLKYLDSVRSSMTEIGDKLPNIIKSAKPDDIRTLERVFEINNYALMTIESYLKMLKVSTLSGGTLNKDVITLVNRWLQFMANYCEDDMKYLDEAKEETKDKATADIIEKERESISHLMEAAKKGIDENSNLYFD